MVHTRRGDWRFAEEICKCGQRWRRNCWRINLVDYLKTYVAIPSKRFSCGSNSTRSSSNRLEKNPSCNWRAICEELVRFGIWFGTYQIDGYLVRGNGDWILTFHDCCVHFFGRRVRLFVPVCEGASRHQGQGQNDVPDGNDKREADSRLFLKQAQF